jgi:hypothetical protein
MVPTPIAIGLTLCEKVIIEEGTRRLTFVNSFTKLRLEEFPSSPQPFAIFLALTGGVGDGTIEVKVNRLDTLEEVYSRRRSVSFPDRLTEVQVLFQVHDCVFPAPTRYQFTLFVDGAWVAQRRLRTVLLEA